MNTIKSRVSVASSEIALGPAAGKDVAEHGRVHVPARDDDADAQAAQLGIAG
jgi:hypothetical protein